MCQKVTSTLKIGILVDTAVIHIEGGCAFTPYYMLICLSVCR
jgi:hypothetical protein